MRSTWFSRAARGLVALALLSATAVSIAAAKPGPERPIRRRALNLFAVTNAVLNVNRVFCGINNLGELCVDPTNSPVIGGGFWPKGTPDQYIFNSGLQLAGVIPSTAGFSWAGDTVGAFFFDARGTQVQGDAVTLVYNSLDPSDASAWPNGAVVRDPAIYHPVLLDRNSISQEDLWTRAWDGNPAFLSGRTHPMGILVEERGLAWNFPTGNEDIIYFVFTFYNVTARNCAVYAGLLTAIKDEICAVGQDFQNRNEAVFNLNIPDNGYPIGNLYSAFSMDPDVGDASFDYSTAILPFNMGVAYKNDFLEPNWAFPADIFGTPFAPSPGFVGVKYLRSPKSGGVEVGLTMFSNTKNSTTGFPDPVGVKQLFRYLSGTTSAAAGDNPCTADPVAQHMCFLDQQAADTRFFQSSGPFTLNPGEAQTIVVAYVHAAPVASVVVPLIGGDNAPGVPAPGDTIKSDPSRIRWLERAAGWVSQGDSNADNIIEQNEVVTLKRSLLDKALVAQAVYNNKFLLPFAPEPPTFFLVPGDNKVTIAWQPSETEVRKPGGGDPFYGIASAPLDTVGNPNPLYDPNFQRYDVEGYRIYRGRTSGQLELVAQFDYAGTELIDYTGNFAYVPDVDGDGISECAVELGIFDDCPDAVHDTLANGQPDMTTGEAHNLVGEVIQVPAGGRVALANGAVLIIKSDTLTTGNASGFPPLANTGVGFAYVDATVRNSFTYHYAVTAFDANSFISGPSSLESPRVTKQVTPRRAPQTSAAVLSTAILGTDGVQLNPDAPYPTIDAATGTFNGNMPPANAGALALVAGAELLPAGDIILRIDSANAGEGLTPTPPNLYMTIIAGGDTVVKVVPMPTPDVTGTAANTWDFGIAGEALVPIDSARARAFAVRFTKDTRLPIAFSGVQLANCRTSASIATCVGRFGSFGNNQGNRFLSHSRWFSGNSEPADPTVTSFPDSQHNAGALPGVSKIWAPSAYREPDAGGGAAGANAINVRFRNYSYSQTTIYPADFVLTWNADSSLAVFDSTHHTTLPYSPGGGTGWGFINASAFTAAGVTPANLRQGGDAVPTVLANLTYNHLYATRATCDQRGIPCITLGGKAQYQALDLNHDGAADASGGIGIMVNGEGFFMALPGGIPAANTKWRLRQVVGRIAAATCTDTLGGTLADDTLKTFAMRDCDGYTFAGPALRPSLAPGLTYKVSVQSQFTIDSVTGGSLASVHTVPDPYYVTNALELTPNTKILKFVNLPPRAIVRIYSVSGVLVNVLTLHDPTGGGELTWNLRNRNNQFVASGVYFYHVEAPDGRTKIGRFTVVNFAQ